MKFNCLPRRASVWSARLASLVSLTEQYCLVLVEAEEGVGFGGGVRLVNPICHATLKNPERTHTMQQLAHIIHGAMDKCGASFSPPPPLPPPSIV